MKAAARSIGDGEEFPIVRIGNPERPRGSEVRGTTDRDLSDGNISVRRKHRHAAPARQRGEDESLGLDEVGHAAVRLHLNQAITLEPPEGRGVGIADEEPSIPSDRHG